MEKFYMMPFCYLACIWMLAKKKYNCLKTRTWTHDEKKKNRLSLSFNELWRPSWSSTVKDLWTWRFVGQRAGRSISKLGERNSTRKLDIPPHWEDDSVSGQSWNSAWWEVSRHPLTISQISPPLRFISSSEGHDTCFCFSFRWNSVLSNSIPMEIVCWTHFYACLPNISLSKVFIFLTRDGDRALVA